MTALSAKAVARLVEQTFEDPEQALAALEAGLAADRQRRAGAGAQDRVRTRGKLLLRLGESYLDRRQGERAENLEKALAAYQGALEALPQNDVPVLWGQVQHRLGGVYLSRIRGNRADNLEYAIAAYEAALSVRTREDFLEDFAKTQNNLAIAYRSRIRGERADNLERAIAGYEAALTGHTREGFPTEWAQTQNNLAIAYRHRIRGERADNLERAIAHFKAALTVHTREDFPTDWAMTQNNLASTYSDRIGGERADNLERAIAAYEAALTVRTREAWPNDWAMTQNNLAVAYARRIRGNRADNLERAIAACERTLTIWTPETFPEDWAQTQNNLAIAYRHRIRGERADNLERAIAAYEAALSIHTREGLPDDWARTQNNLAIVYRHRIRGERADNLEHAIGLYQAALTVYTREDFPTDWAMTQSNLAIAYADRIRGERADNLERAIGHYQAVLGVYTREDYATEWARTQNNLAAPLADRIRGNRADNLEQAIAHYHAALTVRTREAFPTDWAQTQNNLAIAYRHRICGERAANLARAVAAYEAALTVRTRAALPRSHLETSQGLGQALLALRAWRRAKNVLSEARETFLLLFNQGLDAAEAHGLIEVAGPLFTNAAYAAAELGELTQAFGLACEGRARLMATALRLQTLDLASEQRHRLEALRTEIREQSCMCATGLARAEVLDRLGGLRAELSAIIATAEGRSGESDALAQAGPLVAEGGVIVAPIVTEVGGKLLLVTAVGDQDGPVAIVIDLPQLTTERLKTVMRGDEKGGPRGWLAAFAGDVPWRERKARATCAVEGIGRELWGLLAGPLERSLNDLGVAPGTRLIFMPSAGLGMLPLGLAQEFATTQHLLDTYEIVTAPSLSAIATAAREEPAAASLAAIINPTGDLIFAPIEGALVAAHFEPEKRTLLDHTAGTPEAVLAALKGKTHWHFSTHGTFDFAEARRSALAMKDGAPLSVGRLLATDGLGCPRLVVLAACETGLYDIDRVPEEFIGLPGAFMTLGARAVLATLWPVDDCAAALLTAKFYDGHLDEGLAPSTALRKAQLWLRSATRRELSRFARAAKAECRLSAKETRQLERALTSVAGEAVRFFSVAGAEVLAASAASGAPARADDASPDRPFAHPVYWGGFVVTGL